MPVSRRRRAVTDAVEALTGRDPIVDRLAVEHGVPHLPAAVPASDRFRHLAESIVYQQLNGTAAATIWGRTTERLGGCVDAGSILAIDPAELRAAGLSGSKAAALVDLARRVDSGEVRLGRMGGWADEDVVAALVKVRGIGEWTAQMFLMFALGRLDVWPTGDFGVRSGIRRAWGLDEVPSAREIDGWADEFRPYRSLVAWWCWRAADTTGGRSG